MKPSKRLKRTEDDFRVAAEKMHIILNLEDTKCSFCTTTLDVGVGILIQACLHPFCRRCISSWIESKESLLIPCPLECGSHLLEKEIKAIVKPNVYDMLEQKSKISAIPNAFFCKTAKCPGFCETSENARVFPCPACGELNCVKCKAIHGSLTCEEYQQELEKLVKKGITDPEHVQREMKRLMQQNSGFDQLMLSASNPNANGVNGYDNVFNSMEKNPLLKSTAEFECKICFDTVAIGEGIILQNCYHMFCQTCLVAHVENSTEPECKCPGEQCEALLMPREIQALLPPDVLEKVTKRNWAQAESVIASKFHCLTPDCNGFCELDGNVNTFRCPLCSKKNCIQCIAIHQGVSCEDHKNRLVQNENDELSAKAVENMIATGKAMRCPKCKAPVQKIVGCDSVVCSVCRTELCWATKGPRWGPNGKGDLSGGCKCRVNGKLCHPNCQNCH